MLEMGIFAEKIFWIKNKLFRRASQKAYEATISYCQKTVSERLLDDFEKRKTLVEYAYEHCNFYRQLYDQSNFHPSQLKTEEDWQFVPVIEKQMIRDKVKDFVSDESRAEDLNITTTGGSTGKPLKLYKSKHVYYEVLGWRALGWWGISPSDNEAIMHRRVPVRIIDKMLNQLLWWPTRRAYLSATAISDNDIENFLKDVKKKNIKWIVGYCASIEHVADYIIKHNLKINNVRFVWSTSSPLTKIVREKIEKAFNCKVMDQYGCCELGNIAVQKPNEDFLTINADYVHVDIVDQDDRIVNKTKELGDILITDLNTKECPLIKYRLGDRSRIYQSMEESNDGFPKMEFVKGRISDAIWLPDGTYVDGAYLTTICDNYSENIDSYQLIQHLDYSIEVKFIPKLENEESMAAMDKIIDELRRLVNNKVNIKYDILENIPDFAGKRKFIISELSLEKVK